MPLFAGGIPGPMSGKRYRRPSAVTMAIARLRLAARTVIGRPLAMARRADRFAAYTARLPGAIVDEILELKKTGLAAGIDVIAKGTAAFSNRFGQDVAY